jgi:ABC-type Fe3+/spermidine/putrescine transport system ATPase subunit
LTVFENVAFPLRVRRQPKAAIEKRVREALELVGLGGLEQRGATELSGGQQQRVALARAIVYTPTLLLLDEPLSNLDVKLREQMRTELHALHRRLNLAVVYVTHDQGEALALSDRIAVVNQGRLEQVGTPIEVYERPSTRFVGDFLGRTVILKGSLRKEAGRSWVDVQGQGRILTPDGGRFGDGEPLRVLSRPEDITLLPMGAIGPNEVVGRIEHIAYMGDHLEYTIAAAGRTLVLPAAKKEPHAVGTDVRLAFDPAHITILPQ